jgi:hypothetical protein
MTTELTILIMAFCYFIINMIDNYRICKLERKVKELDK